MSTTLYAAETALSKDLNDYWRGTTTGAGSSTTLVDTALKAKLNDWITDNAYDFIEDMTADTCNEEERKISSLDNTTGTLTVLAHSGTPGTSTIYRVHRLFTASEKRIALIAAAKDIFPYCYQQIWDESVVNGNWLKDGSFEVWTTSSNLTYWTETTLTAAKTSSSPYYRHSIYSCKLSTAAGTLVQSISNNDDLKELAGQTVEFTLQGWCDTASCLRISINDGITQTYSDYHAGDSAWTKRDPRDELYVTQTIDENPTEITFTVHHEKAAGISYVDDARVIGPSRGKQYIGYLWLAQNRPSGVFIEPDYKSYQERWIPVRGWDTDENGYLYIPIAYAQNRLLRIKGRGYLDFLASGVASTAWSATIALDDPQLKILTAQAAIYLYAQMSLPNFSVGERSTFQTALGYWNAELQNRVNKYRMPLINIPISWSI